MARDTMDVPYWPVRACEGPMEKAEWQAFGEWVENLRKRSGLQVNELAERTGVSPQWLNEIRRGGRTVYGQWRLPNPKDEALARLARALGVSVDEMLARAGRGASPKTGASEPQEKAAGAAAAQLRELQEQVSQQAKELAELRRLLEQRPKEAGAG
jgi:transcriptional regulator with XRE-family HTH domain